MTEFLEVGPLQVQRFGWHCFVWAWRRGQHRPVGKVFLGWRLRAGVWLGRDDDGDLTFAMSLFGAHYDLVVTTWPEPSAALRTWADPADWLPTGGERVNYIEED